MRAFIVSVDYDDLLAVTLPRNKHHFASVTVVTAPGRADAEVARAHGAAVHVTDAFYRGDAVLNKWAALEEALDGAGRDGWLCLLDADTLWPADAPLRLEVGKLCSPLRRMAPWPGSVPPESEWKRYPVHRNVAEWAGYSQVFHGSDPALGRPPWHEVDWKHAGGADSFFQRKWAPRNKIRPPFEVLHLGPAGENWFGRTTQRPDGTAPAETAQRLAANRAIWAERQRTGFSREKL